MTRSPTNLALPVTFSMPSTLGTLCPTYFSCRLAMNLSTSKNRPSNLTKLFRQFKKAQTNAERSFLIKAMRFCHSEATPMNPCYCRWESASASAIFFDMRFQSRLIRGTLIQRYNRFLAAVRLNSGQVVTAHCTNTGSMLGCKEPGSAVYLSRSDNEKRKLAYTWEMIRIDRHWVGINTLHPNRLAAEGVKRGAIRELEGYPTIRREVVTRPGTRLDLCLEGSNSMCFVEVKNVTLAIGGAAAFPDAVTERGTKHLKELIRLRRRGHRAAVLFFVSRGGGDYFMSGAAIDTAQSRTL